MSADGRPVDFITADVGGEATRLAAGRRVARPATTPMSRRSSRSTRSRSTWIIRAKPEWQAFFAAMADLRKATARPLRRATRRPSTRTTASFEWRDILSLIFCGGWRQPYEHDGHSSARDDDVLTVTPDPFAGARSSTLPSKPAASRASRIASDCRLERGLRSGHDRVAARHRRGALVSGPARNVIRSRYHPNHACRAFSSSKTTPTSPS